MANYPSYYPNNQMPTYQPMYGQQYQNFQPPYQQNMGQQQMQLPQTQQFQQMPIGINGKVVPSVENITANDVPMDGSVAFFPRQDMTEIYAKSWNSDGTIRTIVFKPVLEDSPNNLPQSEEKLKFALSDEATEAFMKRFDELEKRLDDFRLTLTKSSTKSIGSRAKKEVAADE